MRLTHYLAAVLSALALLEGVAAQRGGGRGAEDDQSTSPQASGQQTGEGGSSAAATTTTAAAVTTTTAAAGAQGNGNGNGDNNSTPAATTTLAAVVNAAAGGGNSGTGDAGSSATSSTAADVSGSGAASSTAADASGPGAASSTAADASGSGAASSTAADASGSGAASTTTAETASGSGAASSTAADASGSGAASTTTAGTAASDGATLKPDVIQKASQSDGNPKDGQSPSKTDNFNFINFCSNIGQELTEGQQKEGGSCNPIPMGQIPAKTKMISAILTDPENGAIIKPNEEFKVKLKVDNLLPGVFTNPVTTYYSAPLELDEKARIVIGHVHVVIQAAKLNGKIPLDPTLFAFFKGIDDAGDGKGGLEATVTGGLPAGYYRCCTITSGANHQCPNMPVAQRGSIEDCIYFTVGGGCDGGVCAKRDNAGAAASTSSAAAGATTAARQRKRREVRGVRFVEREFVV